MKIIIINASPRKNGATAKILSEFADNLSAKGDTEIKYINLSDYKLDFCAGCCACYKTGACHIDDDAELISALIDGADGVIIGTPTYASNVSGQLKVLIDRGHFVIEQLLKNKHTVGIVTYENAEGGAALKVLKKLCVFSGARTFGKLAVKLPFNTEPLVSGKIKRKSDKIYKAVAGNKSASLTNSIIHFFVFNFGIKPFVLRKGDRYGGVRAHWERRGI
ncbi:MAG: flavodoxin family protein [Oscillospiraceae bacterium]|nr:flavodoxin family protein [Oscillospiraceae bacterium]